MNSSFPGLGNSRAESNGSNNAAVAPKSATDNSVEDFLAGIFAKPATPDVQQQPPQLQPLQHLQQFQQPQQQHTPGPTPTTPTTPIDTTIQNLAMHSNAPLPQHILFGSSAESLNFSISTTALQKMPVPALRMLASKGLQTGPVVMMKNYSQVESMHRLKSYLDDGKYAPFHPPIPLDYIDESGNTKTWDAKNESSLQTVQVTKATEQLFQREIDLYFFATEIGYEELRKESVKNVSRYPKSAKGVWRLVETISLFKSESMRKYILDLLDANARALTKLPDYLPFLKQMVKFGDQDRELGEKLLDNYISSATDQPRKPSTNGSRAVEPPKALDPPPTPTGPRDPRGTPRKDSDLGSIRKTSATFPLDDARSPRLERRKKWSNLNLGIDPDLLGDVASAILNGRLVVAGEEGWGTLTQQGSGRNKDFKFRAGELLLQSYENPANGHNNTIVYNSKGERGDIRKTYIREVPQHLGVEKIRSVYVPSAGLSDRMSERSAEHDRPPFFGRPDREQRSNFMERERSRSPGLGLRRGRP